MTLKKRKKGNWFYDEHDRQRQWLVIVSVFVPIVLTIVFSVVSIVITINAADNRDAINALIKQVGYLDKISKSTDNTYKSTAKLAEMPSKITRLGNILDTLNLTLRSEVKRITNNNKKLDESYLALTAQQKDYLEKISKVVDLTNVQIKELQKNNEAINLDMSRRVNIVIEGYTKVINGKNFLDSFIISNTGNIECNIEDFVIAFSPQELICDSEPNDFSPLFDYVDDYNYRMKKNLNITRLNVGLGTTVKYFKESCHFKILNPRMGYKLTYSNKNENKTISGTIIFKQTPKN